MFCIDEWDDIAEARSEGDVWKLIDVLASDWKTLRKSNISAQLSTHQTDYVDWRILKRIDYFVWMKGATIHPAYSMITSQNIVSDLPMGLFLIEERKISFGRQPFDKLGADAFFLIRIQDNKGDFRGFRFCRQTGVASDGDDVFLPVFNCLGHEGKLVNIIYGAKT